MYLLSILLLLMEEILHHLGCTKPTNNGMNYQPQLVNAGILNHQQYDLRIYHKFLGFTWDVHFLAGACSSSFDRGNRHFEARRVHRQIAEEVSGGMGVSAIGMTLGGLLRLEKNMGVSENGGFSPQIIHFNRVFHYKPSILGYLYFWKHPYEHLVALTVLW